MIENRTRLSHIAVASAAVLAMWCGVASAENTALSPSNVELDTSAVAQQFISKKLVAIGHPYTVVSPYTVDSPSSMYFWEDGGFSEWNENLRTFDRNVSPTETALEFPGWPEGKNVMAITPNPVLSDRRIFWWHDGSRSDWDNVQKKFVAHEADQGSYFKQRGWPEGKKVVAIGPSPSLPYVRDIYWWSDGSSSTWDRVLETFLFHNSDEGFYFKWRGWPKGKKVSAVGPNPLFADRLIYWWSDGSRSDWDDTKARFVDHEATPGDWYINKGWPKENIFYPEEYEIRDIRVNEHSVVNGAIYANGRMQYKVNVKVQITDRHGNGVQLDDQMTGLNQNGQLRDLVTLYRGDKVVDTSGANLPIDEVGDYTSTQWKASRNDAGYDKFLNTYQGYTEQIDGSIVELDQQEGDFYPAKDGWNSYTYWVSSSEQTGPDPMRICARAGSYGENGEGYYDSCADGRNESAKLQAIVPPQSSVHDYIVTERHLGDMGMTLAEHKVLSVGLKNGGAIRSAIHLDSHSSNHGNECVATYNNHWTSALGQTWNHNTCLFFLPFGVSKVAGPEMYQVWELNWHHAFPRASVDLLPKGKINFLASSGEIHVVVSGVNKGTWTKCTSGSCWGNWWTPAHQNVRLSGRVSFVDNYGTDRILTLSPSRQAPHKDFDIQ
ncbi:hypothetical protein [Vibrio navarrensis]|uniref:hypothetical protein n=1 Tax=Vibrio navarrensis TaxID=29495 RepID=UPI001559719D|nr:hypothetical protein [Vibrio navarrensis]